MRSDLTEIAFVLDRSKQSVGHHRLDLRRSKNFAGALHGQHANKGIFITTSDFFREAHEYVAKIGSRIVLIDGPTLAPLMIDFGVGVTTEKIYEVSASTQTFLNRFNQQHRHYSHCGTCASSFEALRYACE